MVLEVVLWRSFFLTTERVVESKASLFEAIHERDSWLGGDCMSKVVEARSDSWTILVSLVRPSLAAVLCAAVKAVHF